MKRELAINERHLLHTTGNKWKSKYQGKIQVVDNCEWYIIMKCQMDTDYILQYRWQLMFMYAYLYKKNH